MEEGHQLAIYNSVAEDLNSGQPRKISANVARMGLKHGSARLQVQNPTQSQILVNRPYHLIHVQVSFTATFRE